MKKIIALALFMIMVLCMFAGCENNNAGGESTLPNNEENSASQTDPKDTVNNDEPSASNPAGDNQPAFNTVTPGKLTMATNAYFAPYEYFEGDKIVGIDAEIAAAIAEKLGLELVINDMEFNTIITAVTTGAADIGLAGMTVRPDREEQVDFSISYASGVQAIIVKEGSAIKTVDDLSSSLKIGVQLGTTGDSYASEDFGDDAIVRYNNGNEAVLALLKGDIDCIIIDNAPAEAFVEANNGLMILETTYADEDYAACFAKENDALREAVNNAIEDLIMDGTIDKIIEKYIPTK